ncbi:MAG: imidazolonepropionase [Bdellovibrionota bacterium]
MAKRTKTKTHTLAIVHASELLTGTGVRRKDGRRIVQDDIGRISDGALVYTLKRSAGRLIPDRIKWVGQTASLPKKYLTAQKIDLKNKRAVIPGMVDCHTHLVFAGDRSDEFAARCAGATYQEIAARGGGIAATVRATRAASIAELERLAVPRLKKAVGYGVRTIEIKSGYGLSVGDEYKILEVIKRLKARFLELTIVPTFLGAHAFPQDLSHEEYMRVLTDVMLPEVARRKLADSCDIFIDEGYFSIHEARVLLEKARTLGLSVKIHADELFDTGATGLAAEIGALSADHLLKISDDGIRRLANSNTVAVLLPGTALFLKAKYAPARKLIDAGAAVALATDFNPGTCMCLSLPVIMALAAVNMCMGAAEIFAAITYNGAKALGLEKNKGTLEPGMDADFTILPFKRFEECYYQLG